MKPDMTTNKVLYVLNEIVITDVEDELNGELYEKIKEIKKL